MVCFPGGKNGIFRKNFQGAFLFSDFCVRAKGVIVMFKVVSNINTYLLLF
jgi:hypothetical protein